LDYLGIFGLIETSASKNPARPFAETKTIAAEDKKVQNSSADSLRGYVRYDLAP